MWCILRQDLFADYEVMSAEETTLGANQWLKDATRFSWTSKSHHTDKIEQHHSSINDQMSVMLNPMDIKSFVIRLEPKNTSPWATVSFSISNDIFHYML